MKFAALHLVSGPDIQAARRLHDCEGLDDEDSNHILFHQHGWDPKSSFRFGDDAVHLPFFLQHIAAAALVIVDGNDVELKVISASSEVGEAGLLADLSDALSSLDSSDMQFAWHGDELKQLISARRSLLGVAVPVHNAFSSLAQEYIGQQADRDERQLDYISALHQLPGTERPLNVRADQAGWQLAQAHASSRALQLGFLATRQLQVSGQLNADSGNQIEQAIRQQLHSVAPSQETR